MAGLAHAGDNDPSAHGRQTRDSAAERIIQRRSQIGQAGAFGAQDSAACRQIVGRKIGVR
jgi:hypothetical protein